MGDRDEVWTLECGVSVSESRVGTGKETVELEEHF
jgi:hypothetical protein